MKSAKIDDRNEKCCAFVHDYVGQPSYLHFIATEIMTSSNGGTTIYVGNPPVTVGFRLQRASNAESGWFFDVCLNKRLNKPWIFRLFQTLWRSLWRHCNVLLNVSFYQLGTNWTTTWSQTDLQDHCILPLFSNQTGLSACASYLRADRFPTAASCFVCITQ